jgi:copper oxidase (laccase) domain-containing protein
MVANRADTYLFMVVADCLALFYYDQVKKVVALAHAGWRGVDAQVPFKTAFHLMKEYGCKADNILVGMSPAVQKESACYPDLGQESKPEWSKYITKIDDKVCADTNSYAYDQLLSIGIPKENIDRSTIDTRTNTDFFSHLRSKDTGEPEKRFGCVIGFRS